MTTPRVGERADLRRGWKFKFLERDDRHRFAFVAKEKSRVGLDRRASNLAGVADLPPYPQSGGPPLFEPSLKVQGDIAHNQSSGFAVAPGVKGLNARGPLKVHPKWRLEEPALAHRALAGIDRHLTARKPDPHQAFKRLSEMSYGNQVRTIPHVKAASVLVVGQFDYGSRNGVDRDQLRLIFRA
jgi:hypothetical protein